MSIPDIDNTSTAVVTILYCLCVHREFSALKARSSIKQNVNREDTGRKYMQGTYNVPVLTDSQ